MDRPKRLFVGLALLIVFLSCLSRTGAECVLAVDGVEGFFDLSSLQGTIYTAQTPVGGYTYQFAVCGVVAECTSLPDAAVCQSWVGGKANCGVWNSSAIQTFPLPASSQSTGIGLVVRNGDEDRFSYIYVHCDPQALDPINILAQDPQTLFDPSIVQLTHQSGCVKQYVPGEPVAVSPTTSVPATPVYILPPFNVQEPALEVPMEVIVPFDTPVAESPVQPPTTVVVPVEQPPVTPPPVVPPVTPPSVVPVALPPSPVPVFSAPSKPVKKGLSVGSILLITLVCSAFVYFFGGFLFLKCYRSREGAEAIPNHTFWLGLPALVKDGFMYALTPCTGGYSRSYEMIPA